MPRSILILMRPWQWSKNGIVFAGLVFSQNLLEPSYILRSLAAFGLFCLASSAIYVFNDLLDADRDRLHPVKKDRPIASGSVGRAGALILFFVLVGIVVAGAVPLGTAFLVSVGAFLVANVAYSMKLKNVVLLDVMTVAGSFLIRAVAGVMALRPLDPTIEISPWLLVCTLFLALFLALAKRRHELSLLEAGAEGHRATLSQYSLPFLDQLISIASGGTVLGYAIYTIAPGTVSKFHSPWLVLTIPFVVFGVFRYLYLIQLQDGGGNPSRTLYRDLPILLTTLGWLMAVAAVIYAR